MEFWAFVVLILWIETKLLFRLFFVCVKSDLTERFDIFQAFLEFLISTQIDDENLCNMWHPQRINKLKLKHKDNFRLFSIHHLIISSISLLVWPTNFTIQTHIYCCWYNWSSLCMIKVFLVCACMWRYRQKSTKGGKTADKIRRNQLGFCSIAIAPISSQIYNVYILRLAISVVWIACGYLTTRFCLWQWNPSRNRICFACVYWLWYSRWFYCSSEVIV